MDGYPPLPEITNQDLVLAVYTHESLGAMGSEEFGEPKRLAQLGERVLDQTITFHYFMKEPVLSAETIEVSVFVTHCLVRSDHISAIF